MIAMFAATAATAADTHPCAAVSDAAARLACYDAAFGAPPGGGSAAGSASGTAAALAGSATPAPASASGATPATVGAGAAAPAAAAAAPADFGLKGNSPPKTEKIEKPKVEPPSITSTIVSVSKRPYGELVLTLDNGQVWTQAEADPAVRLRPGDTVTIRAAALGSYRLVSGSNVTRVKRIQ